MQNKLKILVITLTILFPASAYSKASLEGGPESIERAYNYALNNGLFFAKDEEELDSLISAGYFTHIVGNGDYLIRDVRFPFVVSETKKVIEILSSQYINSCGQLMPVTSAVRPLNFILKNSTPKTVHPTGIAFDIGKKGMSKRCRVWLESRLLFLEGNNQIDATREKWPAHYHIVVFVKNLDKEIIHKLHEQIHIVQGGDSFYEIARTYGISAGELMRRNGLNKGDVIHPGDRLYLPIK